MLHIESLVNFIPPQKPHHRNNYRRLRHQQTLNPPYRLNLLFPQCDFEIVLRDQIGFRHIPDHLGDLPGGIFAQIGGFQALEYFKCVDETSLILLSFFHLSLYPLRFAGAMEETTNKNCVLFNKEID